ncbi:hypothetical protein BU17DRAFT_83635 [Hysterangium stoloniferum]|nr:hypothetical protein BU17DRAFT_83635 [Hysterangium stoloniferum]
MHQQLDTIIYSGESADDIVPFSNIHVSPFRRSEQFESSVSRSFSQLAAGFRAFTSLTPTPLGQLQNLQGPVKSTQLKIGAVAPTPSEQNHLHNPIGANRASPSHADPDPDANMFLDDGIDVDTEFTPRSVTQKQESTGPSSSTDKVSSKPLAILPSRLDNDSRAACDETNLLSAVSVQSSPSKAHAVNIIARIKANAEIQAATQVQQERNLSPLGLTDSGGDLSDVPKMDSPESDESGLELELDTIVKGLDARLSSSASAHTSTSNEVNTRQSTRHIPNRDVKVKLFRDESPAHPRPEPQSNSNPKATSHAR